MLVLELKDSVSMTEPVDLEHSKQIILFGYIYVTSKF
jgi:hypothetical protein